MTNDKPTAMLIGYGEMGKNHYNNMKLLEGEGRLVITSVVDTDESKIASLDEKIRFTDLSKALEATNPDAVLVCSNTVTHKNVLSEIMKYGNNGKRPALFIEKPVVENAKDANEVLEKLVSVGYGSKVPVAGAYLIRFSPAVDAAIKAVNEQGLYVQGVEVQWQKNRPPKRPSPGVHIDETTHAVDTILGYILPAIGKKPLSVHLTKADAVFSDTFIDKVAQEKLYGANSPRMKPMGELRYQFDVDGLKVAGLSSFMTDPLERNITLYTNKGPLKIVFDKNKKDALVSGVDNVPSMEYDMSKPQDGRVYKEWDAFLKYKETGVRPNALASLEDSVMDAKISDALDSEQVRGNLPYKIQ